MGWIVFIMKFVLGQNTITVLWWKWTIITHNCRSSLNFFTNIEESGTKSIWAGWECSLLSVGRERKCILWLIGLRVLYHTRPESSGPWPSAAVKILHGMIEMTSREGLKVKFDNRCWSWWRTLICNLDTSFWDKTELVIKSKMFFKICKEFSQAFPPVFIMPVHKAG